MGDSWFKPRSHGFGATPTTWQGWAATLGYVAFAVGISLIMIKPFGGAPRPQFGTVMIWAALVAGATAGFVWLSKAKSDGAWKWRWGGKS